MGTSPLECVYKGNTLALKAETLRTLCGLILSTEALKPREEGIHYLSEPWAWASRLWRSQGPRPHGLAPLLPQLFGATALWTAANDTGAQTRQAPGSKIAVVFT